MVRAAFLFMTPAVHNPRLCQQVLQHLQYHLIILLVCATFLMTPAVHNPRPFHQVLQHPFMSEAHLFTRPCYEGPRELWSARQALQLCMREARRWAG